VTFRLLRTAGACLLIGASGACTTVREAATGATQTLTETQPRSELTAVPFFPQTRYQCGPAALATVLGASGVDTTPDELVPEVYLPSRRGSLQAELIAAARRHQRLPYVLAPTTAALLRELAAGRPVLVLQNFGVSILSIWHYAVVVGYDPERRQFILRSGRNARSLVAATRFAGTWRRAGNWAMVALRATELPADGDSQRYLTAASAAEAAGHKELAEPAYRAALQRWPDDPRAWLGLGNIAWSEARWQHAESAFREVLRQQPDNVAARNNLALALLRQGCVGPAEAEIQRALSAAGNGPFAADVADSARQIRASAAAGPGAAADCSR
jgi:tetratricopeptide (TPR) repeat protein